MFRFCKSKIFWIGVSARVIFKVVFRHNFFRYSKHYCSLRGCWKCYSTYVLTSATPRLEYMRKRWKYCWRWRPCSETSFFSRFNTANSRWSLSVALGSAEWPAVVEVHHNQLSPTRWQIPFWGTTLYICKSALPFV